MAEDSPSQFIASELALQAAGEHRLRLAAQAGYLVEVQPELTEAAVPPSGSKTLVAYNLGIIARHLAESSEEPHAVNPVSVIRQREDVRPPSTESEPGLHETGNGYGPTLDDEIAIAARQVTMGGPRGARSSSKVSVSLEMDRILRNTLPNLNALQRRVLVLSSCYKLPPEQIAGVMNKSPALITQALEAASQMMHRSMNEQSSHGNELHGQPEKSENTALHMVLSDKPHTEIYWDQFVHTNGRPPQLSDDILLSKVVFGSGVIKIKGPLDQPVPPAYKCAVLASLGLTNKEIGALLYVEPNTVKTHMRGFYAATKVPNRLMIAAYFLSTGYYEIEKYGEKLTGSPIEMENAMYIPSGMTNLEISEARQLKGDDTVKTQLKHSMARWGLHSREKITLALLLSGQTSAEAEADDTEAAKLRGNTGETS